MRLAFLGSPPFATPVLARIQASEHEVACLVTRPDRARGRGRRVKPSELVELAQSSAIPLLQPESTRDEGFLAELTAFEPQVLLVASYGEILREPMLTLAPHGALNVHASLLPRHRGASPIQRAILEGDAQTGVSIQRIVLALDEGDVLLSKATPINPRETAGELLARLAGLGGEAAAEALDLLQDGRGEFTPQDPARASYAKKIGKGDGHIDWSWDSAHTLRHIRAMTPWPGAHSELPDGRRLTALAARALDETDVLDASQASRTGQAVPGELFVSGERLLIGTGDGWIELTRLKPEGKQAMPAADFLRGARLDSGTRMGGI